LVEVAVFCDVTPFRRKNGGISFSVNVGTVYKPHGIRYQKAITFVVDAMRTPNLLLIFSTQKFLVTLAVLDENITKY
jgi:hypothetical protein